MHDCHAKVPAIDLEYSKKDLLDELEFEAKVKGADAVVGIQYNLHSLAKDNEGNLTAVMYAYGTAVKLL